MLENGKIVGSRAVGPYVHEARKKFKTLHEALEAACANSYSLRESAIGIFSSIHSIGEADYVIDEYYQEEDGRYGLPDISTLFTYDDTEEGIVYTDVDQLPNSIYYQTSTGTNQLIIREEVDEEGNSLYTAIYSVRSENPLLKSSAMQAFNKDGWDCRCIEVQREEIHEVSGIIGREYNPNMDRPDAVAAYMLDGEFSPEDIKAIKALEQVDVSSQNFSWGDQNAERMIEYVLGKFGKIIPLEKVVFGDGEYSYRTPNNITGPIFEVHIGSKSGGAKINSIEVWTNELNPDATVYRWVELRRENPPTEQSLKEMQEVYTPQDIVDGISPREGGIDDVIRETTNTSNEKPSQGEEEPRV